MDVFLINAKSICYRCTKTASSYLYTQPTSISTMFNSFWHNSTTDVWRRTWKMQVRLKTAFISLAMPSALSSSNFWQERSMQYRDLSPTHCDRNTFLFKSVWLVMQFYAEFRPCCNSQWDDSWSITTDLWWTDRYEKNHFGDAWRKIGRTSCTGPSSVDEATLPWSSMHVTSILDCSPEK